MGKRCQIEAYRDMSLPLSNFACSTNGFGSCTVRRIRNNLIFSEGSLDMPGRIRYNIPDFLRAMPVNVSVKDGKISIYMMTRKRLERFDEVRIIDETNVLVEKTESETKDELRIRR